MNEWIEVAYLLTAISFIVAMKLMNSPKTARKGNWLAAVGMSVALVATCFLPNMGNFAWIGIAFVVGTSIGVWSARRVQMTAMPQMVALFNGLGGGAVALVALLEYMRQDDRSSLHLTITILSLIIGSISFSGSMIAFAKLQELMTSKPIRLPGQQVINGGILLAIVVLSVMLVTGTFNLALFVVLFVLALALGVLSVMPIGGADMPVVISMLNSFTGCAAGLAGFVLGNTALLIGGGLVGASGFILTLEMCNAMNRSLGNVIFGAFGSAVASSSSHESKGTVRSCGVEDAAIIFGSANTVVVVPGYGMAVAQAQHVVKDLANKLTAMGVDVKYAVHPVAGRMPGHMNVLLAEADVSYDQLYDLDDINPQFAQTDVALVIGANDVVNPAARSDKSSPIYGMPILDVDKAQTVIVCKRSMNPGFAGIENDLFLMPNVTMVFGNAKDTIAKMAAALDRV